MNLGLCKCLVIIGCQEGKNRVWLCPLFEIERIFGIFLKSINIDRHE